jgi:hypothetical protein
MNIAIILSGSGRGLQKDADILSATLTAMGHSCRQIKITPAPEWQKRASHYRFRLVNSLFPARYQPLFYKFWRRAITFGKHQPSASLIIHLQNVHPRYLTNNAQHWLIPNQEWFIPARQPYLMFMNQVLCKTHHAVSIFSRLHSSTHYLGFTSSPAAEPLPAADKNFKAFLHVAGNSQFKGTAALVTCWAQHSEWPKLIVVSNHFPIKKGMLPANITHYENLAEKELISLWQQAGLAIIPSEVEGYGQVLAEAMSYGCITITTNAPPMNELVAENRGILIPARKAGKFRLGTLYQVTPEGIEQAVEQAMRVDQASLHTLSESAISWHRDNHLAFEQRLSGFISA